jgi:hypothetical protein
MSRKPQNICEGTQDRSHLKLKGEPAVQRCFSIMEGMEMTLCEGERLVGHA